MHFLIGSFSCLMKADITPLRQFRLDEEAERKLDRRVEILRHLREILLLQEPCINRSQIYFAPI